MLSLHGNIFTIGNEYAPIKKFRLSVKDMVHSKSTQGNECQC